MKKGPGVTHDLSFSHSRNHICYRTNLLFGLTNNLILYFILPSRVGQIGRVHTFFAFFTILLFLVCYSDAKTHSGGSSSLGQSMLSGKSFRNARGGHGLASTQFP